MSSVTRRDFLVGGTVTAAVSTFAVLRTARGESEAKLRVGLVGCGKRGLGAARNCVDAAANVCITAVGDVFPERAREAMQKMAAWGDKADVTPDRCFAGFDAIHGVLDSGVDIVLLCAPPAFRPDHFEAAVAKGVHVFMEKPVAVCPAGARRMLQAAELSEQKGLKVAAGTQRRHQPPYRYLIEQIHQGALGEIVAASAYWVGDYDYYPGVPREPGWSDMEWQLRNWNYFTWLSGDHIVEPHVHNLDVVNWALKSHPVKCLGMGGRQQRTDPVYGHIFDHFSVEYEYPGGIRVQSLCRQMKDTDKRVEEYIAGTLGSGHPGKGLTLRDGRTILYAGENADPYVLEHTHLIEAIRQDLPLNEARQVTESTLTAIMGRMSAYTGKEVTWDFVLKESKLDLTPPKHPEMGDVPVPPVAVPGEMPLI